MTRKLKIWLLALVLLALFSTGVGFLGTALGLTGRDLWVLRGGMWLLGAVVTLAVCWFLLHNAPAPPKPEVQAGAEVDAAMSAARSRLRSSRLGGAGALHTLPVVLLVGPPGSAKTTSVVRSGLETELLAGDVFRGDSVAPTRILNLWYTRRALVLEAGGRVTDDAGQWRRLIQHLVPRRVRSAFWGAAQSARAVVVCFSCEELVKPGAADGVAAAARTLRARLGEVAAALGVRLPVYVVFTKADALPHFADYIRNFSRDEVREVFGTTFPMSQMPADAGAEQVFALVDRAFQRLFASLAAHRLKYLPRETASDVAGSAYEFPREFRKVVGQASQFLVELSRSNQLEVSPFLRGFYFVGVRPVVVTEGFHQAAAAVLPGGEAVPVGATTVFDPARLRALANERMSAEPTSRRVPQWVFLERLLSDLILGDRAALAITERGSRRVDRLRRLAAVSVAAAALLAITGLGISYAGNRRLQREVLEVEGQLASARAVPPPTLATLQRLDAARDRVQQLAEYERSGPPWRLRWGLYTGTSLFPGLRTQYFSALEHNLVGPVRDSLALVLRRLPDTPGQTGDYGHAYNVLKAYLITTTHPDRSTTGFLSPVLLEQWQSRPDPPRADLARRQFAFYASELPDASRGGVLKLPPPDDEAIAKGRAFLRQFAAAEAVYRTMLAETSAGIPAIQFERMFPTAAPVVRDPYVVPGAFTRPGWQAMQAAFQHADRYFTGEDWVTGVRTAGTVDRTTIVSQLRTMYVADYVEHWRLFLRAATVARFRDVSAGSRVLAPLSSNQSPLLALLSLVSRHTSVDTVAVAPAFQPVHLVVPPGDTSKYIGAGNEAYVNALVTLQSSLQQIAKGGPDVAAASSQALNDAVQAGLATRQLANKFKPDPEGNVHAVVQQLLETPLLDAQTSLQAVGPAQLNAQGRAFCAPFQRLLTRLPFSPTGVPADLDEVSALFQPGTGALWSFVEGQLGTYVVRQGPYFAERAGSPVHISQGFLAFLNRAAEFSGSMYRPDGSGPSLMITMRPILSDEVPSVAVNIDGQAARFNRSSVAAKRLTWNGAEAQLAILSAEIGGREREILTFPGTWAVFRLFQLADWTPGEGSYSVRWRLPGVTATGAPLAAVFDVTLGGAKPVLRRDFFSGVACSGRIVR